MTRPAGLVLFAQTVDLEGADAEALLHGHLLTRDIPPSWIDAILLITAGNYLPKLLSPDPPSLPGIRAHQRACVDATIRWLRRRAAG